MFKLVEKINKVLSLNRDERYDTNVVKKIQILSIFTIVGTVFMIIYLVASIFTSNLLSIFIIAPLLALMIINFVYIYKTGNYVPVINISVIAFCFFLLAELITGGYKSTGFLWFFPFPFFMAKLLDYKKGLLISLISLFAVAVVFYVPHNFDFIATYSPEVKPRFLSVYTIVIFVVFLSEIVLVNSNKKTEQKLLKTLQASDRKAEVISTLSFEIRSKLNNLLNYTDLLNKTDISEKQEVYIDILRASIYNMTATLDSSELISTQTKNTSSKKLKFDILSNINKIADFYSNKININTKGQIPKKVIGDPVRFKQIFLNIFDIYTQKLDTQNTIQLTVEKKDEIKNDVQILFSLNSNTGFVDGEMLAESEKTVLLTKDFIKECKGEFSTSQKNGNFKIEFSITFEKQNILEKPKNLSNDNLKKTGSEKIALEDARILLIEDDEINQKIIKIGLSKHVKTIEVANNGKEALDLYQNKKFNLIIMDLQMPIMDGFKTTRKIRETEQVLNSHTPIIALTANTLNYDRELCLQAGMNEYLSKPFQINELVKLVEELLENKN